MNSAYIIKAKKLIRNAIRQFCLASRPLLYHTIGQRYPKVSNISYTEALQYLDSLHHDKGDSCICTNTIHADYDLHIIIPVYNTSAYLQDCLNSVFRQETHFSFFVSIINDGSTDNSQDILNNIHASLQGTALYDNIEIIHQDNQGLSCARNRALNNIRGKYIMFVDSDDMLLPNAIHTLMTAAIENGADIAEGNFNTGTTHGCACGKVYSSHLFQHIHFPPGYLFEDTLNIFFLYPLSRKTFQVPGVHYFYRENPTSIMHSFQGSTRAIDSLWVSQRILKDYFSQGYNATDQLFCDYLKDTINIGQHFHTLHNETAMQAMFTIQCHISKTYFQDMFSDSTTLANLPQDLKNLALSLCTSNYRAFRISSL